MFLNFDDKFQKFLSIIFNEAKSCGLSLFIVGGVVRDYYLNIPIKDIDLILEGNALEFVNCLPDFIQVKSVHKDFGTVKLLFEDMEFDLASTRTESYPYSGCLPVVSKLGVPIEVDVLRRDFTVNSMYFEVLEDNNFKLIDLKSGLSDLKSKTLRVLYNKSYIDDPTRIFRGLAFKYRFNLEFSKNDEKLINDYLNNIDYSNSSFDRILSVFKKTLDYPFGLELFKEIVEKKYYKILTPKFVDIDLNLIGKISVLFNLNSFQFSDLCEKIVLQTDNSIIISDDIISNHKQFSKLKTEELAYLYYLTQDENIINYLNTKNIKLAVTGDDLLKIGFKQGQIIGDILDRLLEYKILNSDKFLSFDDELDWVKSNFPLN